MNNKKLLLIMFLILVAGVYFSGCGKKIHLPAVKRKKMSNLRSSRKLQKERNQTNSVSRKVYLKTTLLMFPNRKIPSAWVH